MIYVRVELWPKGDRTRAKLLQEATITNTGGTLETGQYAVAVSHSTTLRGDGFDNPIQPAADTVWKRGSIAQWGRNGSPMNLVYEALRVTLFKRG